MYLVCYLSSFWTAWRIKEILHFCQNCFPKIDMKMKDLSIKRFLTNTRLTQE